jgi:hypothetical protein
LEAVPHEKPFAPGGRATSLAIGWICLTVCACSKNESTPSESAAASDTTALELRKRGAYFSKLMDALPKTTEGVEKQCPDERITRALEGEPGRVVAVEHGFLDRFAGGTDLYAGAGARFKGLTTPAFRILVPSARATSKQQAVDALWNIKKLEREYTHIGVLRAKTRSGPTLEGDKYQGGTFSGALFVVEMGKVEVLCAAEIRAESSESFATKAGSSADDAAFADYVSRVRGAVHDGLKRISKRLELDL